MMRSLFSAVSGLKNHQTAMDVIGNNISNVNTVAFKSSSVVFENIYSQTLSSASGSTATTGGQNAQQAGLGVTISGITTNTSAGSTETTGNTLDFSVDGEGYFVVQGSDGSYCFTRNGNLTTDEDGNLVTRDGNYVMIDTSATDSAATDYSGELSGLGKICLSGENGEYTSYDIDSNGFITAYKEDGTSATIGRVILATFNNPSGLVNAGGSLYSTSANSGDAILDYANEDPAGSLTVGSLEMSNVDLATELTNMIIMQRGFQANSRVITTSDSMLEELVNLKRS